MTPPLLTQPCPLRLLPGLHGLAGYRHCVCRRTGQVVCLRPGREVPPGFDLCPEFVPPKVAGDYQRGSGV